MDPRTSCNQDSRMRPPSRPSATANRRPFQSRIPCSHSARSRRGPTPGPNGRTCFEASGSPPIRVRADPSLPASYTGTIIQLTKNNCQVPPTRAPGRAALGAGLMIPPLGPTDRHPLLRCAAEKEQSARHAVKPDVGCWVMDVRSERKGDPHVDVKQKHRRLPTAWRFDRSSDPEKTHGLPLCPFRPKYERFRHSSPE